MAKTVELTTELDCAPDEAGSYHEGIVERVLVDLEHEGQVTHAGPRWYLRGRRT